MSRLFGSLLGTSALVAVAVTAQPSATTAPKDHAVSRNTHAEKHVLTLEGARAVVAAIKAEASKLHVGGAIAVVDDGGHLLAFERVDGTFAAGSTVSLGKARTAALFKKPTSFFETVVNKGRTAMTALPDFTPLQGGVPIEIDGQIVGAVGVSGASSAQQDEDFAVIGAKAVAEGTAHVAAVEHFASQAVAASFQKGEPLFEGDAFRVHASRRDAPGKAELHPAETDIVYVMGGSASFVTGGQLVGEAPAAGGEVFGESIQGGTSRTLQKGDVVVVPAGTPHWFQSVNGPFTYYVVKVRQS